MYLGCDLGTTNVKAVVTDGAGQVIAAGSAPVDRYTTPDGAIEQDIEQIWAATCAAIRQALGGATPAAIRAVGVSSQGGALQLLDAAEQPVGRVISWLDGRGRPFDLRLTEELGADFLAEHVGHAASTMTIGQVLRLQQESPDLFRRVRHIGFVGDVIVGRLCGRRAQDATSLAIAMLYNPWLQRADPAILARLKLEEGQLPDLLPATTLAGVIHQAASQETGLPAGIPVSPAVHDQYAVSLGAGSVHQGDVTFGAGTAWVLLANGPRLVRPATSNAFVCSHLVPGVYGQLLSMRNGGSAIQWVLHLLGCDDASPATVDQMLAVVPPGCDGLRFWPLLATSAAADEPAPGGGRISGITLNHQPGHLLRAVVEGLACELGRHLTLLAEAGIPVARLTMCGGAAASRLTPQIIADVTRQPLTQVEAADVSAIGAAVLAQALLEPGVPLRELAERSAPPSRLVLPGENADLYREVRRQYMAFWPGGRRSPVDRPTEHSSTTLHPQADHASMVTARLHHVWTYTDVDRAFWREHLEDWLPMEIFDAHTHINEPRFGLETMSEEKRRQHWSNEVCEPIGAADAQRCHEIVFPRRKFSCLAFGLPFLEYDIEASNASLQEECARRGWYRLAVVRPQWTAQRVAEELDQSGVLGVKVYYALIGRDATTRDRYLEASIFDFLPHDQLELLDRRGAWVTLHVPKADRLGHPANIAEVRQIRRQYPRITLVLAHLGRSYTLPHAEAALPQLAGDEGLYFDLSAVLNPEVLRFAIATLGPERLLYGSDNPIFYMRGRQQWQGASYVNCTSHPFAFNRQRESPEIEAGYTLYMYEALRAIKDACTVTKLPRAGVEAIFHGNARRLIDAIASMQQRDELLDRQARNAD